MLSIISHKRGSLYRFVSVFFKRRYASHKMQSHHSIQTRTSQNMYRSKHIQKRQLEESLKYNFYPENTLLTKFKIQFLSEKYTSNKIQNTISIQKRYPVNRKKSNFYSEELSCKWYKLNLFHKMYHQTKAEYLTDNQICYLTFWQNIKIFLVFCLDNTNKISYLCSTIGQHHYEMVKITGFVTLAKVRGHPISPPTQA